MRKKLVEYLIDTDNDNRYFLTADVGYPTLDPLKEKMGNRFINCGISEQAMISIASGLALDGREVITYTMCAFYLRALEQIKLDICCQDVPVLMIGIGTGFEYGYFGNSHYATEDEKVMSSLRNIYVVTVGNKRQLVKVLRNKPKMPMYLRIPGAEDVEEYRQFINYPKYPKCGGTTKFMNEHYGD